ncbi:MAG: lytic transglycosylase domain-containing protein [Candidatus Puniceispirillales bacterium]
MRNWRVHLAALMIALLPVAAGAETIPFQHTPHDLPKPLSPADVDRYQQIFDLQQDKKWKEADRLIKALDNDLLLGRVLSQRYLHPTGWRSTYKELRNWLAAYNDHPAASRISWLANKRRPANAKAPKAPKKGYLNGYGRSSIGGAYIPIPATTKGRASPAKTRSIARKIRYRVRSGWPTGALELLNKANLRYLTKYEEAVLRADIAHGYFIYGKDIAAISQSKRAIALAGKKVPRAYWTAGISAWRHGDLDLAMVFFRPLTEAEKAPAALVSAGAFWASRGALRRGEIDDSFRFLEIASRSQDSFYGMLAAEALGQDITLDFSLPPLRADYITWLNSIPGGQRAFALLQVGETYHASRELRYLWEEMTLDQRRQTMVLAARTHMAGLSFRTADILRREHDQHLYAGLYPIPDFETGDPIRVDQALLLAVMRQESGFNPRARSWAKASGLMQLMPSTAAFIARDRRFRGSRRHDLMIPEINIRLGEDYILHLFDEPPVNGDLVRLLAAYNGGPGNLNKWMRKVNHGGDTLMLLESLPSRETRFYVKNVLTNYWIYRKRLGKDGEVLASIAAGDGQEPPADAHLLGQSCSLTRLSERCAEQP